MLKVKKSGELSSKVEFLEEGLDPKRKSFQSSVSTMKLSNSISPPSLQKSNSFKKGTLNIGILKQNPHCF